MVRNRRWAARGAALLAAAALAACEAEPTAPTVFSISGHVRLSGSLLDEGSRFMGTRVIGDADGVLVELVYGSRVAARTTTVDGVYRFTGIRPGGYVARAPVVGTVADETRPLTVAVADIAVGDTLLLESRGDLYPVPNPSVDTCRVYYEVPEQQQIEIRVIRLDGTLVRTLVDREVDAGLRLAVWDGLEADGSPATARYYWVTFASGTDYRAHLLLR